MVGREARRAPFKEENPRRALRRKCERARRIGHERSGDAMRTVIMLRRLFVHRLMRGLSAAVVRVVQRHHGARVAAQRQRREQRKQKQGFKQNPHFFMLPRPNRRAPAHSDNGSGGRFHFMRLPKSRSTSRAQLCPGAPVTPPPGCAPAPQR